MKAEPRTSLNYIAFTNHRREQQQPIISGGGGGGGGGGGEKLKKVEAPSTIVPIVQYIVAALE
jgi:hypothetical protein